MRISVVIPTYNRRQALTRCLDTLFEQDFLPIERELIVVVDGSRDGTGEMLRPLCNRGELFVVEQENKGQTAILAWPQRANLSLSDRNADRVRRNVH